MPGDLTINPYRNLVSGQSKQAQNRENAARYARFECKVVTTGSGQFQLPDAIIFDCTFNGEPHMVSGLNVAADDLAGLTVYPSVTAFVTRYIYDPNGFCTGAYVGFNIDAGLLSTFEIHHYLTFSGIAIKGLPAHLLDQ